MFFFAQSNRAKVFKRGLSLFFKGCLPQNSLSPLLNTLSLKVGMELPTCEGNGHVFSA